MSGKIMDPPARLEGRILAQLEVVGLGAVGPAEPGAGIELDHGEIGLRPGSAGRGACRWR